MSSKASIKTSRFLIYFVSFTLLALVSVVAIYFLMPFSNEKGPISLVPFLFVILLLSISYIIFRKSRFKYQIPNRMPQ